MITNEVFHFIYEIVKDSIDSLEDYDVLINENDTEDTNNTNDTKDTNNNLNIQETEFKNQFYKPILTEKREYKYNIEDLVKHVKNVIYSVYQQYFNFGIGKYHVHYLYQIVHEFIFKMKDTEWFQSLKYFDWQEDYNYFDFDFIPQNKEYKLERVDILNNKPKQVQGTKEWLHMRKKCLTASNITNIINNRGLDKIILNKCGYDKLPFITGDAIKHGTKYEDVAVLIYENRTGIKVYDDYGCIPHEEFNFIGASPDGIDETGNVIEIKCVYSRKITGLPKEDYYDQMQLQMEVFKLNKCLFLECEIKEYECYSDYKKDVYIDKDKRDEMKTSNNMEKGVIIRIITGNPDKLFKYIYPENLKMTHKDVKKWVKHTKKKLKKTDPDYHSYKEIEPLYWRLTEYSCIQVYKDKQWMDRNIRLFYNFWKQILEYRLDKQKYQSLIDTFESKKKQAQIYENNIVLTECYLEDSSDEDD